MSTIKSIAILNPTPVTTQIAKPTIPNKQFKSISKPIFQEKPKFQTINLFPPKPPQPVDIKSVKPDIVKPKSSSIEDYLPALGLAIISFFVLSRTI